MQIRPLGMELFRADGRTDGGKDMNFVNSPTTTGKWRWKWRQSQQVNGTCLSSSQQDIGKVLCQRFCGSKVMHLVEVVCLRDVLQTVEAAW